MKVTKLRTLLLTAAMVFSVVSSVISAEPEFTDIGIFAHSTAKNKAGKDVTTYFRIPSIVTANDGTILAFCNARVGGPRDGRR